MSCRLDRLVLSVFKTTFTKSRPKEIVFRIYRKFNENKYNRNLRNQLSSKKPKDHASFEKEFFSILKKLYFSTTSKPCTVY